MDSHVVKIISDFSEKNLRPDVMIAESTNDHASSYEISQKMPLPHPSPESTQVADRNLQ